MDEYWTNVKRQSARRQQLAKENPNDAFCHDCNVIEGEIHSLGCDMEVCPWCGDQLITCGCVERRSYPWLGRLALRIPISIARAERTLSKVGRVPYIHFPQVCCRCGEVWPDLARQHVSQQEWLKYVEIERRGEVICTACFARIKCMIDERSGGL